MLINAKFVRNHFVDPICYENMNKYTRKRFYLDANYAQQSTGKLLTVSTRRFFENFQAFYSSSSNLRRHIKSRHEQSNSVNSKSNDTVPLQPNQKPSVKYICELCGKVLKSRYR